MEALTSALALLLLLQQPQVNKLARPPGVQAWTLWRQHWYAIWWIYSNYCSHTHAVVWPRLQGKRGEGGWKSYVSVEGGTSCLPHIYTLQVTAVHPTRSCDRKETTTNQSHGRTDSITHSWKMKSMFAVCSRQTDSGSDKQARVLCAPLIPHHVTPRSSLLISSHMTSPQPSAL